jgi:hypothetical protein
MPKTPLTRLLDYIIMIDDGSIPVNIYFRIENLMEAENDLMIQMVELGQSKPTQNATDIVSNVFHKFEKQLD